MKTINFRAMLILKGQNKCLIKKLDRREKKLNIFLIRLKYLNFCIRSLIF